MNAGDGFDDRLRERFVAPPPGASTREDCPDASRIMLAATGRAPFGEVQTVLDHAAACAACTVALRFAREQAVAAGEVVRPRPSYIRYAAAAAVLVIVAAGIVYRERSQRPEETALRTTGHAAIRSAMADGAELPRGGFHLRWTPGPAGTRYQVLVTDERLAPIAEGANLGETEFHVPEAALAALPDGARVLWQVRAVFPDGTHVATETFVARIGGPAPR